MSVDEAGAGRMLLTLGVAGFCSGLALVGIYLLTLPRIERNRAEALEAAIYRVLPGTRTHRAFVLENDELVPFQGGKGKIPKQEAVFAGYDEKGRLVGFAIPAEGPGFQDTIRLLYGYDPTRRRVTGLQVLESRETPGLGDKITKDRAFLAQFEDLAVAPEVALVKRRRQHPNEVDAISGATISSRAVVSIINRANRRWLPLIAHAATEAARGASRSGTNGGAARPWGRAPQPAPRAGEERP